jgi:predicted TIM-barrel fold metal-dependent hydrolase
VRTALEAFGLDRCVWGSDWPFLGSNQGVSYERMLACLERFLPRAEDRRRVLWQAPARLFGFVEPAPDIPIHG